MRAYGMPRMHSCCPGHDRIFAVETYCNNRSKKARSDAIAIVHRMERRKQKKALIKNLTQILADS